MINLDADQAFVQVDIDAELSIRLPPHVVLSGTALRLSRVLQDVNRVLGLGYGKYLGSTLKSFSFDQSQVNPCRESRGP
ncbi:unnamed protein product, partial [Discosporangium mesarthrocarpum]